MIITILGIRHPSFISWLGNVADLTLHHGVGLFTAATMLSREAMDFKEKIQKFVLDCGQSFEKSDHASKASCEPRDLLEQQT
jgi:hypothetical protein